MAGISLIIHTMLIDLGRQRHCQKVRQFQILMSTVIIIIIIANRNYSTATEYRLILLHMLSKNQIFTSLPIAVGNTGESVYYLDHKSTNVPRYPHWWLHVTVRCSFGQVCFSPFCHKKWTSCSEQEAARITQVKVFVLLLFCLFFFSLSLSLGWVEMPNLEVFDCQLFSELCTRGDLVLSSSSQPQEMETSLLFQRDMAGV